MSDTRKRPAGPRLEFETRAAARLEPEPLPLPATASGARTPALMATGAAILAGGLALLSAGDFVAAQFERATWLGGLTLGVCVAGFGLIGAATWRELRGLFALRTVDRLRADLLDPARMREAADEWLSGLPEGDALREAVRAVNDPDAILSLLRAGPLADLRARSDALGRAAAIQVFAITAAVPSPALDGLLVAWRGARLVREVAEAHGMRPGLIGTLALLRRTALSAASVMASDLATDAAARAILSSPLLAHVAGDVAGAGIAARRMIRLSHAAAAACAPLD